MILDRYQLMSNCRSTQGQYDVLYKYIYIYFCVGWRCCICTFQRVIRQWYGSQRIHQFIWTLLEVGISQDLLWFVPLVVAWGNTYLTNLSSWQLLLVAGARRSSAEKVGEMKLRARWPVHQDSLELHYRPLHRFLSIPIRQGKSVMYSWDIRSQCVSCP